MRNQAWMLVGSIIPAMSAAAQEAAPAQPDAPPPEEVLSTAEPIRYRLGIDARYEFETDLDAIAGEVQVARAGWSFGAVIPAAERLDLDLGIAQTISVYDFSGAAFIPGAPDPWDEVVETTASLNAIVHSSDKLILRAGVEVFSGMELDAEFEDSFGGGARLAAMYVVDERLLVGGGLGVRSRLVESDLLVFPILIVNWQINEHWSLANASGGPGLVLGYAPSHEFSFFGEFAGQYHEFVLDDQGPVPSGAARQFGFAYALGASWNISERLTARGRVGLAFTELDIHNAANVEVASTETDPQLFVSGGLAYRF